MLRQLPLLLLFSLSVFIFGCDSKKSESLLSPGLSTIDGRVSGHNLPEYVFLRYCDNILGEVIELPLYLDKDGRFSFSDSLSHALTGSLILSGREFAIPLIPDSVGVVSITVGLGRATSAKLGRAISVKYADTDLFETSYSTTSIPNYFDPDGTIVSSITELIKNPTPTFAQDLGALIYSIRPSSKTPTAGYNYYSSVSASIQSAFLFDALRLCRRINTPSSDNEQENRLAVLENYRQLLSFFDLSSPHFISSGCWYGDLLDLIVSDPHILLPLFDSTNPTAWSSDALQKLSAVLPTSLAVEFCSILVANQYGKQLIEMRPFSGNEQAQIRGYFSDATLSALLLSESAGLLPLLPNKGVGYQILPTPPVPPDDVLSSIIDCYAGKSVLVYFWSTWNESSLVGFYDLSKIAKEYESKNIVFVFITDESSPEKLWRTFLHSGMASGDHYRLDYRSQASAFNSLGFRDTPCYVLYDKSGRQVFGSNRLNDRATIQRLLSSPAL